MARAAAVAIVVVAKYPAPGRVKTRLAATIGAHGACALYANSGFVVAYRYRHYIASQTQIRKAKDRTAIRE